MKKVRCISNNLVESCLTVGNEYEVGSEDLHDFWIIKDDTGSGCYLEKRLFEEIKTIKVRCIDNHNFEQTFTLNKIYEVSLVPNDDDCYMVKNDAGVERKMFKYRFDLADDCPETQRHIPAPIKKEPEENQLYSFFKRCDAPNSCPKCSAPMPCKYH